MSTLNSNTTQPNTIVPSKLKPPATKKTKKSIISPEKRTFRETLKKSMDSSQNSNGFWSVFQTGSNTKQLTGKNSLTCGMKKKASRESIISKDIRSYFIKKDSIDE